MEQCFKILHHSYRLKWASGQKIAEILDEDEVPDWKYYVYNLVFRASGNLKEMCMKDTQKWKEEKVCIDTEKYDEYIRGLSLNYGELTSEKLNEKSYSYYPVEFENNSGIDRESLFVQGYLDNFSPFLIYIDKFDVFQFREYIQYNPATTGIIQFIEELKHECNYGITANYSQFYSCLKALEGFWD